MTEMGRLGQLIGGQYRLISQLGQGGMGVVWKGMDELLDRPVAIKQVRLPTELSSEQHQTLIKRSLREARSAARLDHPSVITVHNVVEAGGCPWIVMEYVEGSSLDEVIRLHGPLDPRRVRVIAIQLLEALSAAHHAGVIHRDVKPANVLLKAERAILTDFGIAALEGDVTLTRTGGVLGTPAYMSPEQARGLEAAPSSDLWCLGASLYAALEGHPPFTGPNVMAVLAALISEEPRPADHAGPLQPVVEGLLRKQPSQRLTASQALDLLRGESGPAPTATSRRWQAAPIIQQPRTPTVLAQHSASVTAVAYSVDGSMIATGSKDATVAIWDAARTKLLITLTRHTKAVNGVAFSPDGALFATVSDDKTARLWTIGSTAERKVLVGHTKPVSAVAFSPDGTTIATASLDSTVRLWDLEGRQLALLDRHHKAVSSLAFSPEGRTLATGSYDKTLRLWDVAGQQQITELRAHRGSLRSVAFSPDGSLIVTGGFDDTARVWQPGAHDPLLQLDGHRGAVNAVGFNPSGDLIATAGADRLVRLWNARSGKELHRLTGHTAGINALAFDGTASLASGSDDRTALLSKLPAPP